MDFVTGVTKKEALEISELLAGDLIGKTVKVNGAVHAIRDMRGRFRDIKKERGASPVCL